jgi:hypothetical protein
MSHPMFTEPNRLNPVTHIIAAICGVLVLSIIQATDPAPECKVSPVMECQQSCGDNGMYSFNADEETCKCMKPPLARVDELTFENAKLDDKLESCWDKVRLLKSSK